MDFYRVVNNTTKQGVEIYPDFRVGPSKDLMVRGGSFLAVWDEEAGQWSTDEFTVQKLIDADLYSHAEAIGGEVKIRSLRSFKSNMWRAFRSFALNMPDSHTMLDGSLTFADTPPRKEDYSTKRLPYSVKAGPMPAYERMMVTHWDPAEREKLEWAAGAILSGDSKRIQKFFVMYGEGGTGKSTYLNILEMLFEGYVATFDARALTGSTNAFATESFAKNPLVAIQHDGDLSGIKDNTSLNSIVSHETILVNAKYKTPFVARVNAFLFIGTNQSVKITDAKSGLIRRLIDVHPTGNLIPPNEYEALKEAIKFELPAIAAHCLKVYKERGMNYYSRYRPMDMILRTDIFYNFLTANYELFKEQDGTTLTQAWGLYKIFCDEGSYDWRLNKGKFRDELRNYFEKFHERSRLDGHQSWNVYTGFLSDKLGMSLEPEAPRPVMVLDCESSLLDGVLSDRPAQYANKFEKPGKPWAGVKTSLSDLDTERLHYVKPGEKHIVIDFDLTDEEGEKSLAKNLEAASVWPATYAELSKGGSGVHLHYWYDGDPAKLSVSYSAGIEVKTFTGDSSLRRRLTKCNDLPVASISSGLPLKESRVIDAEQMKSEKGLRELILRNLRKEIHPHTKSSIDFIWKILEDAWQSGMQYDVTDMRQDILALAAGSTHQAAACIRTVMSMKFASESAVDETAAEPVDERLVHFDVEVFPNLLVICWKFAGDASVVRMINPTPAACEELLKLLLVGFNNRRFDNHILYARIMGYGNQALFNLSQRIIAGEKGALFAEAYNLSYTDIYDYSSEKKSLKKFQIDLGLNHLELGLPWDQPVPEEDWERVADYCANDVITQEQVHDARRQDFVARQILAALSGLTVNDTTQKHAARIIFGKEKEPQSQFVYTDLAEMFPGYEYSFGKSTYHGEVTGEGGYVYAEPGMYTNVAVLDIASMHPTSIRCLDLFGPYTKAFGDIVDARLAIKRKDYDAARTLLNGALEPYLGSEGDAKALANALKLAINIVYGLTSASFPNQFRDKRNKDNIVAKRGALFMVDLKLAVQEMGFQVVHIKTDSIKIPGATPDVIKFVMEFGQKYGYTFEHEVTYSKMCLVNDAVYIAKEADGQWTATGAQFAQPYVFKTLFSGEPVEFDDYVEVKTVTTALYLQHGDDPPVFVGRAGAFVPVLEGTGGGVLLREKEGKFHAATGAKGYEWKEAELVRLGGLEDTVDTSYFRKLADAALDNISQYGDAEWFRS